VDNGELGAESAGELSCEDPNVRVIGGTQAEPTTAWYFR
jgi:hypothetical protein